MHYISAEEQEPILPTTIEEEENNLYLKDTNFSTENSFWKYKPFLKGPKVPRYKLDVATGINAHKPLKFTDPAIKYEVKGGKNGFKISSKYRIGEGNDITANPQKLATLGAEIREVQQMITQANYNGSKATKRKLISR